MKLQLTPAQAAHPRAKMAIEMFRAGRRRDANFILDEINKDIRDADAAMDDAAEISASLGARDRGVIRERVVAHPYRLFKVNQLRHS